MAGGTPTKRGQNATEITGATGADNRNRDREDPQTGAEDEHSTGRGGSNAPARVLWTISEKMDDDIEEPVMGETPAGETQNLKVTERDKQVRTEESRGLPTSEQLTEESAINAEDNSDDLTAPNSVESNDGYSSSETDEDERMTFYVPFRLDLHKTQWNPAGEAYHWVRKVFAIVKHADATAAIRGEYDERGKRKRFREIQDVPQGGNIGIRIKTKQHRNSIRTLFGQFETKLRPAEINDLHGIRSINTPTRTFRIDHYEGELTTSVGWISHKHPFYTHTETYSKELYDAASKIILTREMIDKYKDRLPAYDPRRKLDYNNMPLPHFHITTEEKKVRTNGKKFSAKVLAVHTAKSAGPLIMHVMSELRTQNKTGFIPATLRQLSGPNTELTHLRKHKEAMRDTSCITVFDVKEEALSRTKKARDGRIYSLEEYIRKGMRVNAIERTNATLTEGKLFLLMDKQNSQFTRQKVTNWLPGVYKKFLTTEEIQEGIQMPRLSYSISCSSGVDALNRELTQMANGIDESCAIDDVSITEDGDEMNLGVDEEKIIITKKQKINYKEALSHKTVYKNDHHGPTPGVRTDGNNPARHGNRRAVGGIATPRHDTTMRHAEGGYPPRKIVTRRSDPTLDMTKIENKIDERTELLRNEAVADKDEVQKMFASMNKWMDDQQSKTQDVHRELDQVRKEAQQANKEQTTRFANLSTNIVTIGKMVESSQRTTEQRVEMRLEHERSEQDKRIERLIMMNTERMLATYMASTKSIIETEIQKVSIQVAQTTLDLDGIKSRLQTIDMDQQVTGEVAASVSDYLARETKNYKVPDSVDYEAIVTPSATPAKPNNDNNILIPGSPPFGEAQDQ